MSCRWSADGPPTSSTSAAERHGLNYIKLDGNVGCMVNGAGLAMATMDIIKHHGGEPANFLDVGGGATTEMVTHAFRILLGDRHVKAVLINIFGGIMRCDVVAQGIVDALGSLELAWPIVVRLDGTNAPEGRAILAEAATERVVPAATMREAAEQAVRLAGAS